MRNEPPKNNRLKTSYVLIYITSLPFRVREAYHLVTRLLLQKIIAHIKLSSNLFFSSARSLCYSIRKGTAAHKVGWPDFKAAKPPTDT